MTYQPAATGGDTLIDTYTKIKRNVGTTSDLVRESNFMSSSHCTKEYIHSWGQRKDESAYKVNGPITVLAADAKRATCEMQNTRMFHNSGLINGCILRMHYDSRHYKHIMNMVNMVNIAVIF